MIVQNIVDFGALALWEFSGGVGILLGSQRLIG